MKAPEPVYIPGPCVRCGARTEQKADGHCQPSGDDCPGMFDDAGKSIVHCPDYLKRLNAWCDAQAMAEGAA